MTVGDFNDIKDSSERRGREIDGSSAGSRSNKFVENINKCALIDLGCVGSKLTWTNGQEGFAHTYKHLDRGMANARWRTAFPDAYVRNLPRITAQLLSSLQVTLIPLFILVRLELNFLGLVTMISLMLLKVVGTLILTFMIKLLTFKENASEWNKNVVGNIFRKKNWILARLNGVQKAQCERFFHSLNCLEKDLRG